MFVIAFLAAKRCATRHDNEINLEIDEFSRRRRLLLDPSEPLFNGDIVTINISEIT